MFARWLFAILHLLALGLGLGSIWGRRNALRAPLDGAAAIRRVLTADTWWAVAAALWLATGLYRAFGGIEKGSTYYLHNHLFLTKMGFFVLIFMLEMGPMLAFITWRKVLATGQLPDTSNAASYARTSTLQTILVIIMVIFATGMARGVGYVAP